MFQTWLLLAENSISIGDASNDPDTGPPWAHNPFGRELIKSL